MAKVAPGTAYQPDSSNGPAVVREVNAINVNNSIPLINAYPTVRAKVGNPPTTSHPGFCTPGDN